jgi:hypothetical protein
MCPAPHHPYQEQYGLDVSLGCMTHADFLGHARRQSYTNEITLAHLIFHFRLSENAAKNQFVT